MEDQKSKLRISSVLNYLVLLILVGLVVFLCITIYQGLMSTARIGMGQENCPTEGANCIIFTAKYDAGMAVWKPVDYLPLSFLVTVGGFEQDQNLEIACPLAEDVQDDVVTRLKFLINQTKISQCRVNPV
jgi:hypothetical protein